MSTLLPRFTRAAITISVVLGGLIGLSAVHAAEMCVNNVALLEGALSIGQIQSTPYTIKIVQGIYLMDAAINATLSSRTSIEGGYTANCASRDVDPANTIIDIGPGRATWLQQPESSPEARLDIDGLTFRNANKQLTFVAGSTNTIVSDDNGSVHIRNSRFTGIDSIEHVLVLTAFDSHISMENVLFDHLASFSSDGCAISMNGFGGSGVAINHMTADLGNGENFCLDGGNDEGGNVSVYNSILWSSTGGHPLFIGNDENSHFTSFNNIYDHEFVLGSVSVVGQINADPRWIDPAGGNYRLKTAPLSPAINSGTPVSPGGEPATDIEGHVRSQGIFPDRGAYESSYNDQTVLVVSNTQDSGAGSLRQAMLAANSSPALAKQITFDIRGALNVPTCPAVINLDSPLPSIAAPMSIDGYTQPLSSKNTDPDAFNAATCVLIKSASGSLGYGFRVPQTATAAISLSLRGVGMGGFSQPVMLLGGSNHVIAGNQFGGTALGIDLPGASLNAVAIGVNAGGTLIVGGPTIADRNVIGGAEFAGVSIQTTVDSTPDKCQIINNLIGLTPSGTGLLSNSVGINAAGSGCSIDRNRIAGNTSVNLWINGGANGHLVQQNVIGWAGQNSVANNAIGILVNGSNNIIGAGGNGGTLTANTVRYNQGGGVIIRGDGTSTHNNSVNANYVYYNGGGASYGASQIDLQVSDTPMGPTENDPGDLDTGPNDLQNFPVAKNLVYTGSNAIDRPATLSGVLDSRPGAQRVDVYFSSSATSAHRGQAQQHLSRATVVVDSNGRKFFSLPILVPSQDAGGVISMTATDAAGNTSEIGNGLATDTIFADSLD
ncbi:MAG: choice-of-anchor Q domain-containing protein [Dokdonella sp.]